MNEVNECLANKGVRNAALVWNLSVAYYRALSIRSTEKISKPFIKSAGVAHKLLELQRSDIRLVTGFYMGHNFVRCLKNMGEPHTDSCRFRDGVIEPLHHIPCGCAASCKVRYHAFGELFMMPPDSKIVL